MVNRALSLSGKEGVLNRLDSFKKIFLNEEEAKDVKNIAHGVFSPLRGFLRKEDFERVLSEMRLADGMVWPIPIVLDVEDEEYEHIKNSSEIILFGAKKTPVAVLTDIQIYSFDKDLFAGSVFGTKDRSHPGVADVYKMGNYLVGGEIGLLEGSREPFPNYNFIPQETRQMFKERGWNRIVAFQTRNVPHRGHEFLQKRALEETDGLFVQPVVGEKKLADFKDEYILATYETLIDRYYPRNKVFLGVLPLKMRYAGPREAVLHALIRKNFGCTHFIVGRDHAGVGSYYPAFAAQEIFDNFSKEEIGIEILKFSEVVYCPSCQKHIFLGECQHKHIISFSGTRFRKNLEEKEDPPPYIVRPEVYNLLSQSYNSLVDNIYKNPKNKKQKGFVVWITGLSKSGKTTIGDKVFEVLKQRGIKTERLDGDIIRQNLSRDLGFSKEDRDENIRRIGFISSLLSRNDIGVVASFISPYREERRGVKERVKNFIEVFCNCPLEVCENRDEKGLYRKARQGEIQNFTGISDPYEFPEEPEVELKTDIESVEESVKKVIQYLERNNFV